MHHRGRRNRVGLSLIGPNTHHFLHRLMGSCLSIDIVLDSYRLYMGFKRSRDEAMADAKSDQAASPFMTMFEGFRKDLDEHHDRRERTIKASRDITAASKKM